LSAGQTNQGTNAIAIGYLAGANTQRTGAIAIGAQAGQNTQGTNSIAIGNLAGSTTQAQNTIIMNASGVSQNVTQPRNIVINASTAGAIVPTTTDGLFIRPIRAVLNTNVLLYDTTAPNQFEITHQPTANLNMFQPAYGMFYRIGGLIATDQHISPPATQIQLALTTSGPQVAMTLTGTTISVTNTGVYRISVRASYYNQQNPALGESVATIHTYLRTVAGTVLGRKFASSCSPVVDPATNQITPYIEVSFDQILSLTAATPFTVYAVTDKPQIYLSSSPYTNPGTPNQPPDYPTPLVVAINRIA
jgi:hypothetical protein